MSCPVCLTDPYEQRCGHCGARRCAEHLLVDADATVPLCVGCVTAGVTCQPTDPAPAADVSAPSRPT